MISSTQQQSHLQNISTKNMAKLNYNRARNWSVFSHGILYAAGASVAVLLLWAVWSFYTPTANPNHSVFSKLPTSDSENDGILHCALEDPSYNRSYDPPDLTFYDDSELSYTIEQTTKNWDYKRRDWLKKHPSFACAGASDRILMVTGSQSKPCKNPIGDHLLLRFFKNKVDYCRIHGCDFFYNNVLLQPKMFSFWAKMPAVKAAMLAHPEAEWIWWVDSDAAITDMDFKLPMARYKAHNLVFHGWPHLIYEKKSWTGLNAGVFVMRNCQWSMDFMEAWAEMGPQAKDYEKWGKIQRITFKDKIFPESDDQTGIAYLLLKEKEKWGDKIYMEREFYFEGYWMEIVGTYDNITEMYRGIERQEKGLRRRHAEKVSEGYAGMWEEHLKDAGNGRGSWRRPFITHFTGCQPCSGDHNQMYSGKSCWDAMQAALNFADNQVLRNYGFVHRDLSDSSTVLPLPFDYPASSDN